MAAVGEAWGFARRHAGGESAPADDVDTTLFTARQLVASGAAPGLAEPPERLQLHVDVLDAVSGRPLFRQVHQVRR